MLRAMEYPSFLVAQFESATAFAEAASSHPLAPRKLERSAVYMWKARGVPWMWRPVVSAMLAETQAGDAA